MQNKSEQTEWGGTIYRRKNESARTGRGTKHAKPPTELRSVKIVKERRPGRWIWGPRLFGGRRNMCTVVYIWVAQGTSSEKTVAKSTRP